MGDVLRVVQAGCGGMGRAWIKNLLGRRDVQVVGLVDLSAAAAEKARDEAGGGKLAGVPCGSDLPAMLGRLKPDMVVDVTIPEAHRAVTLAALKAGCHVLGEKPMADSMASAREMVAAAKASGRTYMVSQSRRFCPMMHAALAALGSGAIGTVHTVNADFYLGPHFGGFRDQMASPLLLDMAIHHFDQARALSAADPEAVYAVEYNPPGSWYKGDVSAQCLFELRSTAGPVLFNYRGSWCAEGFPTSWQAAWRIVGSKGTLIWDGDHAPQVAVVDEPKEFLNYGRAWTLELPGPFLNGIAGSLDEFVRAIREGRQPVCHAADNIKSLAMVFAAVDSAQRRVRVAVEA